MKAFFAWLKSRPDVKFSLILALIGLSLLPGRNHFYDLDLGEARPLVRTVNLSLPPLAEIPVNTTGVKAPVLPTWIFMPSIPRPFFMPKART